MMRTTLAALVAASLLAVAAGCGGESADAPSTPAETRTTLTPDESLTLARFSLGALYECDPSATPDDFALIEGHPQEHAEEAIAALRAAPDAVADEATGQTTAEMMGEAAARLKACSPELADEVYAALGSG